MEKKILLSREENNERCFVIIIHYLILQSKTYLKIDG